MKTCTGCKKEHDLETKRCNACLEPVRKRRAGLKPGQCPGCFNFHTSETKYCEECKQRDRIRGRKSYKSDPKKHHERVKEYRRRNPETYRKSGQRSSRAQKLKRYGLTPDDFNRILHSQGGMCAIPGCGSVERLCVDHCHTTGRVRAILCTWCNSALGHARESKPILLGLINYLNSHSS